LDYCYLYYVSCALVDMKIKIQRNLYIPNLEGTLNGADNDVLFEAFIQERSKTAVVTL
jgi:hypothetical protein